MFPTTHTIDAPTGQERRAQRRYETIVDAPLLVLSRGREHLARVANFSLGGLGIELDADLPPNCEMEIDHPIAGRIAGICRWRADGLTGFSFQSTDDSVSLCCHFLKQMVPEIGLTPVFQSTRFL